jgi:uncharacterized membrane protein
MIKVFLILFLGLSCEAVGFAFLGRGLRGIAAPEVLNLTAILRVVKMGVVNGNLWLGLLFQAMFFGTILILISRRDVSFILPLTTLGMVFTTLAARFILQEQVSALRWTGVLLIVLGSTLVSYSEHAKTRSLPSSSVTRAPTGKTMP